MRPQRRVWNWALAPLTEKWVYGYHALLIVGCLLYAVGFFNDHDGLMSVGLWLCLPWALWFAVMICVMVPLIIIKDRRKVKDAKATEKSRLLSGPNGAEVNSQG